MKRMMPLLIAITLSACSSPLEEKYQEGYAVGYADGVEACKEEGKSEALDCVRSEGGGAEDAADYCE